MKGIFVFLFSIASIFLFGQNKTSSEDADLMYIVKEFKESIASGDSDRFNRLFFSKSVPFVGIMSNKTEFSLKKDYPKFEGVAVSNHKEFIQSIENAKKKQADKIFKVKKHTDGKIANISFDYAYYNGNNMKQWGHEKWNLVKSGGEWLITDVVYSIHFPDVEPCPFIGNEIADISDAPTKRVRPIRSKPIVKKRKKKRIPFGNIEEEDEDKQRKKKEVVKTENYDDEEEEENEEKEYEEEEEEEEEEKPTQKKSPFSVIVNGVKKGKLLVGISNVVNINYGELDPHKINMFLTVKDVEYRKQDDGSYIVKPLKMVEDFPVYIRIGKKTINHTFKVKGIPLPRAVLGRRSPGKISKSIFKAEAGLLAIVDNDAVKKGKCRISSFIITKNPGTKNLKSKLNKGGRFETRALPLIKSAKSGDVYVFEKIKCSCAGESGSRVLKNITYEIK